MCLLPMQQARAPPEMCFAIVLAALNVGSLRRRFSAADLSPDGCARRAQMRAGRSSRWSVSCCRMMFLRRSFSPQLSRHTGQHCSSCIDLARARAGAGVCVRTGAGRSGACSRGGNRQGPRRFGAMPSWAGQPRLCERGAPGRGAQARPRRAHLRMHSEQKLCPQGSMTGALKPSLHS